LLKRGTPRRSCALAAPGAPDAPNGLGCGMSSNTGSGDGEWGSVILVIGRVGEDVGGAMDSVAAAVDEELARVVDPYPGIP